jgi:hypothetical protein
MPPISRQTCRPSLVTLALKRQPTVLKQTKDYFRMLEHRFHHSGPLYRAETNQLPTQRVKHALSQCAYELAPAAVAEAHTGDILLSEHCTVCRCPT